MLKVSFFTELKNGDKLLIFKHDIIVLDNMGIIKIFQNTHFIKSLILESIRSLKDAHFLSSPVVSSRILSNQVEFEFICGVVTNNLQLLVGIFVLVFLHMPLNFPFIMQTSNYIMHKIQIIFNLQIFCMPLTKERAQSRRKAIQPNSIYYNFHILVEAGTHYSGISEIHFDLVEVPQQLALDFTIQEVSHLIVNGEPTEVKSEEGFIFLDVGKLKVGSNTVLVQYRNQYNNDGSGCVSFVDVDEKQYLYTQFEPYAANRVFPIFDQPDLKAKMNLGIMTPPDWKRVISNENAILNMKEFNGQEYLSTASITNKEIVGNFIKQYKGNMTVFPSTKPMSTYLYCFVAGAYEELKLEQTYKGIPMSLFCIESLFKYLKDLAPFVFEITIESMKLFESFFGYEFAWNKYDQIFVHEYKWGAMENAGCVTFNDLYVWKEKVSTQKMLALANTISHELAHHWFGNLVTMKWWDDLWLNESFADFISHFCLQKIKNNLKTIKYESSMAAFINRKAWGYHEDQMITTHPIRGPVPNTSVAQSIFDGITYSKGAATMKQLLYIMEEQNFSKALNTYFHKYEFNNATLTDFMAELSQQFHLKEFTLEQWRELWLERASLNVIDPSWDPASADEHSKIVIKMQPVTMDHPTMRPHKIKIGLFKEDFTVDVIQTLLLAQEINEVVYDGRNHYKAILLNYEDHTFVKNNIDGVSREFFLNNLDKIDDILSRTLIWRSFFQMVKDAKITSVEYLDFIEKNLGKEVSDSIFERQFLLIDASIDMFTPSSHREQLSDKVFNLILDLLKATSPDNQNRIVILKSYLGTFAASTQNKKLLLSWLDGKFQPLAEHPMTLGQEWKAVVKAFTMKDLSQEEKENIYKKQLEKDSSDTAKLHRKTCDALKANKEEFMKIYNSFKSPEEAKNTSTTAKQYICRGWNHLAHLPELMELKDQYFKDIVELSTSKLDIDHLQFFIDHLQPIDDNLEETIARYEGIKLQEGKFDKINRIILKKVDNLKRRAKCYAFFAEKSKL